MIQALATLALVVVVGRTALARTPPGHTGAHALGELPLTAAASFVLGLAVLTAESAALAACGARVNAWTTCVPWIAAGAVQLWLGPGALVPRHLPVRERPGILALGIGAAAACGAALAIASAAFDGADAQHATAPALARLADGLAGEHAAAFLACLRVASAVALVCVCARGLAGLGANLRAACLAAIALALASQREFLAHGDALHALLAGTTGVVFGAGWLVRAERRSLALAVVAFALVPAFAGALVGPGLAGLAGLVATCVLTARPSRARAACWCGAGVLGALLLAW